MKKHLAAMAASVVLLSLLVAGATASQADTVDGGGGGYGAWALSGAAPAFIGSVTLGGGFPGATFAATSRQATVQSGKTVFLPAGSAPGQVFGSSQNQQYLNQRPLRDTPTAPGTTTYTFGAPTPSTGWGFVLGDIDADMATVSATDADGKPVAIAGLGFRGVFNYCDAPAPRPCTGDVVGGVTRFDLPTWDAVTGTLRGSGFGSNMDTSGASGWFMPTVPLKTLTITYTMISGFPVYQTWFATAAHDISGTVSGCIVAGVPIKLRDANGGVVAATVTDANGDYAFQGFVASDSYTVAADAPTDCTMVGASAQPVDLSHGDVRAVDFKLADATGPTATATATTEPTNPTGVPTDEPTGTASPAGMPSSTAHVPGTPTAGTPTAGPAEATSSPSNLEGGLAHTGASKTSALIGVAALLLAVGAGAVSMNRRRSRH
ncbi:SdrD B-like domain-containing protein [Specibacter cremeus]|uniref:SdrD B-like domain-containing protein n=1 Tax=Specibacter cremeus TaxID=1629051 RepID=UPI000F77DF54|nr:SdrD B-like domain-containing protein [Specibacter cremeus]